MAGNYVIHPIPLFSILDNAKAKMIWYFDKGVISVCVYIWYVKDGDKNILIDAGDSAESAIARGHEIQQIQTLEAGLRRVGLGVDDIDYVIVTHSHHDHIRFVQEFPKAKVIIQRAELEFARNPHPLFAASTNPPEYNQLLEGLDLYVVEGDTEISDGIKLLLTPGHTPGTQSVAINTEQGTAIITGFCCVRENIEPPAQIREKIPFIPCGLNVNLVEAYESGIRVKGLADLIVPLHEIEFMHKFTIP